MKISDVLIPFSFFIGLIMVHIIAIPIAAFHQWVATKSGAKFNVKKWRFER